MYTNPSSYVYDTDISVSELLALSTLTTVTVDDLDVANLILESGTEASITGLINVLSVCESEDVSASHLFDKKLFQYFSYW